MIAVEQSLGLWIPQVTGRYINEDWNTENKGFGAQCWDVAANWCRYLGLPVISTGGKGRWPGWAGNMVDAFPQSPEIAAAYELIGPDAPGEPGDIPVWGDGYYYYPKTHVAVLVRDLGGQLLCVSQNSSASLPDNPYPEWTTGPTILQHLPRRGLIGFIRPRTGSLSSQGTTTATTPQEGFLMALTEEQQKDLYYTTCTAEGQQIRAQKDAEVLLAVTVPMLDGGRPTLGELLAVSNDRLKHIKDGTDLLPSFNRDVRGEFDQVRARNAVLTAALTALSDSKDEVSTDQVLAAIEAGVEKFTATFQLTLTKEEGK